MERSFLVIVVVAIIGAGILAGGAGLLAGGHDSWSMRDYTVKSGECWVHPQGDPLYDEHYAKNVNTYNCKSYEAQEQAKHIAAETRKINTDTNIGIFGLGTIGVVVFIIAILFLIMVLRSVPA